MTVLAEFTLELPEPWRTAEFRPAFIRPIAEVTLPRRRSGLLLLALLKDGTNVIGLTWDRGARLARVGPDTDWKLEERFTGRPPGPGEGALIRAWRVGVNCLLQAGKDAEAELAAGFEPPPACFCIDNPEAMDYAWEEFQERNPDVPVTREQFELGVEVLAVQQLEARRRGRGGTAAAS